MLVIRLWF